MESIAEPGASPQPTAIRALVLSNSDAEARLLADGLTRASRGIVYERVPSPGAMKQALLSADWDVVLLDHRLPGLSSRTALRILKSTGRDTPFGVCASRVRAKRNEHRRGEIPAAGSLTGLATRERFLQLASAALDACGPAEQAVVCFIDFAHFGLVNATFGYATGDALLEEIGARLRKYTSSGLAGYCGGDEFVVLQGGFRDEDSIHRYVQDLCSTMSDGYGHGELKLHVASDVGVSVYPAGGRTLSELVLNAQTALQQCKRLMGRDAYLFYFPELNPAHGGNILLDSALSQALERDELRLYYQPCVSLASGRVTSVEALVRWRHPELGLLASERFIPLAAECGLVGEIDCWVLREASRQGSVWKAQGHAFTIAVNISASEFAHPRLLGRAAMALRELGGAADALEIEVTESALVHDTAASMATLKALRNMGVRIAIDDFGTGYSSLAYLKRFPVDILKIDKSFVKNIAADPGDAAIAQTIITLARNLGLTVQAEGVEMQEQLEILTKYGCDRAQGHLFARPVPAEELLEVVSRLEAAPRTVTAM